MADKAALERIAAAAVAAEMATGVPAQLSAAQCIFESGWLKYAPGNNCFGIKDTDRLPGAQYQFTNEFINGAYVKQQLAFEVYPSLTSCFIHHGNLITSGAPYKAAWAAYKVGLINANSAEKKELNLRNLIYRIAGRYATDPKYAEAIYKMASSKTLTAAISAARLKVGLTVS